MDDKDAIRPAKPTEEHAPKLDSRVDALIGAKLRNYYDGLMAEPVPDRILELVSKLAAKESEASDKSS